MDDLYKTYFDSMPCYLSIQDRNFKIIDANERFRKNFGDHEGRYCYQVYKQQPEKCVDCPVERTFLDGRRHRSEEQVRTLDGREVSVIVYTTPIRDESGEITAVMEMSTNITLLKQLQQQVTESQARYRLLFEDVPCHISIQDRDLNIVDANRLHREAFGTFYGCKCYKVYKHRDTACDPCTVQQTFADGQVHIHEEVVTKQNGDCMNAMVTTAPLKNVAGEVEHVIEMSTDITQIRELQDKLSSVGMIISSISHDLKGLLNGLDGGIYLVNTGLTKDDSKRVENGWEMVLRNVDRIRSTVLDILYYARDRQPDWQEVTAKEIGEEVFNVMEPKAAHHGITLKRDLPAEEIRFDADPQAIRSLLVNLVDNAFDACRVDRKKDQHEVVFAVKKNGDMVDFEISDNGIGMNQEVREKAFSLFFSSKGSGGTGLGLFIANKIAQAHSGGIKLDSTEGVGTTFTVSLPLERPEPADEVSEDGTDAALAEGG
ncbi:MAG: PAS domain-containing sensor histidine kinase [bacterium]